eukprot:1394512-Prymnesium_polylepis.1
MRRNHLLCTLAMRLINEHVAQDCVGVCTSDGGVHVGGERSLCVDDGRGRMETGGGYPVDEMIASARSSCVGRAHSRCVGFDRSKECRERASLPSFAEVL